ncbi:ABC transporter permease [Defluviitalea saccharophila]|uniref:ABC transporter permease n=1 Tax=Defluviitalea saccharophila TaxID=879970 RepID=A0ABZ2Y2S9_9FIRM
MQKLKTLLQDFSHRKIFWPLVAIAVVLLINLIITPSFFRIEIKNGHLFGSLIDILNRATPLIIMAIGMTLVIATGGIDISVGSIVAISGAIAATLIQTMPVPLAIVITLIAAIICGMWNGMLVSGIGIQPMIATLILMTVGRGVAQLITNGQIITINNNVYSFIGTGYLLGLPFAVFIAAAVILVIFFLTRKTAMGLFIESVGGNSISSKYAGIKAKRIIFQVYVICGICTGIAGLIISSNIKSADANNAGLWMELDAILATVIGGTSMSGGRFYIGGTVAGALFIQSLTTTIYSLGVPPETILVVKAVVIILVCLSQSNEFRSLLSGIANQRQKKVIKA